MHRIPIVLCLTASLFGSALAADENASATPEQANAKVVAFFEAKIRPVLIAHCYECHSAEAGAAEGDLRLDDRAAIRAGGGRGPAVVLASHLRGGAFAAELVVR